MGGEGVTYVCNIFLMVSFLPPGGHLSLGGIAYICSTANKNAGAAL